MGQGTKRRITFVRPYESPPEVAVWLTAFDMACDHSWRLNTYRSDITPTGFTIHVVTWYDIGLRSATATWVAYTAGKKGVCSGRFDTHQVRPGDCPQPYNSGYRRFPLGEFTGVPRVFMVLHKIDIKADNDMRLLVKGEEITAAGMMWSLNGAGGASIWSAGASYIAMS